MEHFQTDLDRTIQKDLDRAIQTDLDCGPDGTDWRSRRLDGSVPSRRSSRDDPSDRPSRREPPYRTETWREPSADLNFPAHRNAARQRRHLFADPAGRRECGT